MISWTLLVQLYKVDWIRKQASWRPKNTSIRMTIVTEFCTSEYTFPLPSFIFIWIREVIPLQIFVNLYLYMALSLLICSLPCNDLPSNKAIPSISYTYEQCRKSLSLPASIFFFKKNFSLYLIPGIFPCKEQAISMRLSKHTVENFITELNNIK